MFSAYVVGILLPKRALRPFAGLLLRDRSGETMRIQPTTDAGGKRRGASVVGSLRQRRQLLRAKGRAYARVITAFYGALLVGLMTAFPTGPAQAEPPRSVLILDQSEPNSPWGNEFRATLR